MKNPHDTDRLAALIGAKLQVLEILARLSRRQLAMISEGQMTALVKLLSSKQTVMSQLQALEQQLQPFRGDDPEARLWRSAADRSACQAQADRCNALLAEALTLEKQAEEAMVRRRDAAAATLSAAQTATDARSAYATLPLASPGVLQVDG